MNRYLSAAFIALAATLFATAPIASAAPAGPSTPSDTIDDLRSQGYQVQVNGMTNGSLADCSVNEVRGTADYAPGKTVYVNLSCRQDFGD